MNVLLITADTLRADHLGCYGYARPTSPNLDALATEGLRFDTFIGQCAHTLPSFTSMMTGRTPFQTGVVATLHCVPDTPSGRLSDRTPVLAEMLAKGGVHTAAVDNLMNFACHPSWFARGFAEYINPNPESFVAHLTADRVNELLLPLLARVPQPFFIWAHYWDPHQPYNQPDEFLAPFDDADAPIATTPDGRRYIPRWGTLDGLDAGSWAGGQMPHRSGQRVVGARQMIDAYDGEIRYLDARLGDVFDKLQALALYDDTTILFTADHGETLADHLTHFCHVEALDACTRLPLLVKPAKSLGIDPGTIAAPTTHTDLAPTILDLCGVAADAREGGARFARSGQTGTGVPPADAEMEGHSLRPLLEHTGEWPRRHVVSTGMYLLDEGLWKSIEVSARTERWRLVHRTPLHNYPREGLEYSRLWEVIAGLYESEPPFQLFDTANDPDELTDVAADHPDVVAHLTEALRPATDSPFFYREADSASQQ